MITLVAVSFNAGVKGGVKVRRVADMAAVKKMVIGVGDRKNPPARRDRQDLYRRYPPDQADAVED